MSPLKLRLTFVIRRSQADLVPAQDGMVHQAYILISRTLASEMLRFLNAVIPSLYTASVSGHTLQGKVNGMAAMV
jgi:hypothetical protein